MCTIGAYMNHFPLSSHLFRESFPSQFLHGTIQIGTFVDY